jgi:hypothetical protein
LFFAEDASRRDHPGIEKTLGRRRIAADAVESDSAAVPVAEVKTGAFGGSSDVLISADRDLDLDWDDDDGDAQQPLETTRRRAMVFLHQAFNATQQGAPVPLDRLAACAGLLQAHPLKKEAREAKEEMADLGIACAELIFHLSDPQRADPPWQSEDGGFHTRSVRALVDAERRLCEVTGLLTLFPFSTKQLEDDFSRDLCDIANGLRDLLDDPRAMPVVRASAKTLLCATLLSGLAVLDYGSVAAERCFANLEHLAASGAFFSLAAAWAMGILAVRNADDDAKRGLYLRRMHLVLAGMVERKSLSAAASDSMHLAARLLTRIECSGAIPALRVAAASSVVTVDAALGPAWRATENAGHGFDRAAMPWIRRSLAQAATAIASRDNLADAPAELIKFLQRCDLKSKVTPEDTVDDIQQKLGTSDKVARLIQQAQERLLTSNPSE